MSVLNFGSNTFDKLICIILYEVNSLILVVSTRQLQQDV